MTARYYLAYGSNLHPLRLSLRIPSATLLGVTRIPAHRIVFHKRGQDSSGKCNLISSANGSDQAYGAVYRIDPAEKAALDRFESSGRGYMDAPIEVAVGQQRYECFAYFAQPSHIDDRLTPFHWYKRLVILGAEYLRIQPHYVDAIRQTLSKQDPDPRRRVAHETLVHRLIEKNREIRATGPTPAAMPKTMNCLRPRTKR